MIFDIVYYRFFKETVVTVSNGTKQSIVCSIIKRSSYNKTYDYELFLHSFNDANGKDIRVVGIDDV